MKLTPKQQRFVDAYCGNATDAARQAGYKSPEVEGHRLLRNAKVLARIEARDEKPKKLRIATREERQHFWTKVMMDEEQRMTDRLKAAELLGKSNADFIERVEVKDVTERPVEELRHRAAELLGVAGASGNSRRAGTA